MIHRPFPPIGVCCSYTDYCDATNYTLSVNTSRLRHYSATTYRKNALGRSEKYVLYGLGTTWEYIYITKEIVEPFL